MNDFNSAIRLSYELEGLLELAAKRGNDTPAELLNLISEKSLSLSTLISEFNIPSQQEHIVESNTQPEPEAIAQATVLEEVEDADMSVASDDIITNETSAESILPDSPKTLGDKHLVLTLNDKYKFKRELFNGSDDELNDTLDALTHMNNLDEVEEYLYNDLCLYEQDPTVKEFVAIIKSRFE